MTTIHNLNDSLAYSHRQADEPWWNEVYQYAFPDMVSHVDLRPNGWHQKAGRDRAVVLSTGRTIWIDEKVRDRAYEDILMEVWSVYPADSQPPFSPVHGAVPGWAVRPKDCDYLAYAFVPIKTCYLFPYFGILAAWRKHGATWRGKASSKEDGYDWVVAKNKRANGSRYDTISIPVPITALQAFINDALTISWE